LSEAGDAFLGSKLPLVDPHVVADSFEDWIDLLQICVVKQLGVVRKFLVVDFWNEPIVSMVEGLMKQQWWRIVNGQGEDFSIDQSGGTFWDCQCGDSVVG